MISRREFNTHITAAAAAAGVALAQNTAFPAEVAEARARRLPAGRGRCVQRR